MNNIDARKLKAGLNIRYTGPTTDKLNRGEIYQIHELTTIDPDFSNLFDIDSGNGEPAVILKDPGNPNFVIYDLYYHPAKFRIKEFELIG